MSGFDTSVMQQANAAQRLALDPAMSVWVSASAGTGKTEVLTRRLLALLLSDVELQPRQLLALTFTRAGAGEMAARLPERLREWAMLDDASMAPKIEEALGLPADAAMCARVRALAKEVVEAPPVVSTIHGLAQMLLGDFPLEAGVARDFSILEDSEQRRLLEETQHRLLTGVEGPLADQLAVLLDELGDYGWRELTDTVVFGWRKLRDVLEDGGVAGVLQRLDAALELRGGEGWALGEVEIRHDEDAALRAVVESFPDHSAGDVLRAEGARREMVWRDFLLTKDVPRKRLLLKKEAETVGEGVVETLAAAQQRVAEQVRLRKVLRGRQLTEALVVWGAAVKAAYHARKTELGVLDYDDLLDGLERLLAQAEGGAKAWVGEVLERRFSHLVVDEAQDNNAQQDRIIRALMRVFLAGESGGMGSRSMMAVGDVKQSVFRFQGAVPELFLGLQGEMQRWAGEAFRAVDIQHSFRSGPMVLAAVDEVFAKQEMAAVVQGSHHDWLPHVAVARGRPGRVEVWPLVGIEKSEDIAPWALPQERYALAADGADVRCARQLGEWLKAQVAAGVSVPSAGERALRWEDILVVVQRNKVAGLVAGVWRGMGIPVASGVGVVEQAVMDVAALVRWVFNPYDKIALVTVLKGLRGWDDAQVLALAARAGDGAWHEALPKEQQDWLKPFKDMAFGSPLPLVERAVVAMGWRLGRFASLLEWAERADSLAELVARLEREELPAVSGGDGVRVLTVHGAKGLQAPLVVLPDTMARLGDTGQERILWGRDTLLVRQGKGISLFEDKMLEEESGRRRADGLRGLYVAMTRAADWLVVAGFGEEKETRETWWGLVNEAAKSGDKWQNQAEKWVLGDDLAAAKRQ
ncbi:MAG: AAA family ATPase [Proteobacteria bacterium]|nr:AAA family ATPase [Pseudomonadota bacterium]